MSKLAWFKTYPADWRSDPDLNRCSVAARGLWHEILCLAALSEPYGYVLVNGKPPTLAQLKRAIAPRERLRDFRRWFAELDQTGILKRDADGVIVCRRLIRERDLSDVRRTAAEARWKDKPRPNGDHTATTRRPHDDHSNGRHKSSKPLNGHASTGRFAMQKSRFASTESESESESPLTPLVRNFGLRPIADVIGVARVASGEAKEGALTEGTGYEATRRQTEGTGNNAAPANDADDEATDQAAEAATGSDEPDASA